MPGTAVMSKLASSSTIMMLGGLPCGRHGSLAANGRRPSAMVSYSIQPPAIISETTSTPEREKIDM